MYNSMYNNFFPYQTMGMMGKRGIMSGINKISWSTLLTNTQKTLNVINQAIPVYYQVKPIYNNAKTMFRVFGALKDDPVSTNSNNGNTNYQNTTNNEKDINQNRPIFFS